MSLFRRCQRLQPLVAHAYKPQQFGSASYIVQQTRNGGGGHGAGFPRAAWDLSPEKEPKKFPAQEIPNANEPKFFLFMRTNLSRDSPPKETTILFCFLMVSWGYGLWYNSKYNPHH